MPANMPTDAHGCQSTINRITDDGLVYAFYRVKTTRMVCFPGMPADALTLGCQPTSLEFQKRPRTVGYTPGVV